MIHIELMTPVFLGTISARIRRLLASLSLSSIFDSLCFISISIPNTISNILYDPIYYINC